MQFKLFAIAASALAIPFAQAYPSPHDLSHDLTHIAVLCEAAVGKFHDNSPASLVKNAPKGLELLNNINSKIEHQCRAIKTPKRANVMSQQEDLVCAAVHHFIKSCKSLDDYATHAAPHAPATASIEVAVRVLKGGVETLSIDVFGLVPVCNGS